MEENKTEETKVRKKKKKKKERIAAACVFFTLSTSTVISGAKGKQVRKYIEKLNKQKN